MLRAGALTALAVGVAPITGCDIFDSAPERNPAAEQVAPLIKDALDLAARYTATVAGYPELADRLDPVAEAHRAHAGELARATGAALPSPTPSGAVSPPPPTGDVKAALAELRAAEQQARTAAVRACLDAPAERAALLGSIAAARTTHLEVLR
ncbi:MAG TPA: hypothetical protein VGD43_14715 [Micromonospora sp.]